MAPKKKAAQKASKSESGQTFDQKTVQEFKEAFQLMDSDKDGVISKSDLKDLYATMGQIPSDSVLDEMIKEAPGPLNFTTFLTLFGDRLTGTDPEDTIVGAFRMFDKADSGFISDDELKKILTSFKTGNPLTNEEINAMYKGNPPITGGKVDYKSFAKLITTGAQEELANA